MYHFYVQGERDKKGGTRACHYEFMTEQTKASRFTNKFHGKLNGVLYYTSVVTMSSVHKDKFPSYFIYLCCSA